MSFLAPKPKGPASNEPHRRETRFSGPVPVGFGTNIYSLHYIEKPWNYRTHRSSKKEEEANPADWYSLAGWLRPGPVHAIRKMYVNGRAVPLWITNPEDGSFYVDREIPYSVPYHYPIRMRVYWGYPGQPVEPILNGQTISEQYVVYAGNDDWQVGDQAGGTGQKNTNLMSYAPAPNLHPPYSGFCYVVFYALETGFPIEDQFGGPTTGTGSLPSIEFELYVRPTLLAGNESHVGVSPVAVNYEWLKDPRLGLGMSDAIVPPAAWQAGVNAAATLRSQGLSTLSPLVAKPTAAATAISTLNSYFGGFLKARDGQLLPDLFPEQGADYYSGASLTTIDRHDLVEDPEFDYPDSTDPVTEATVKFLNIGENLEDDSITERISLPQVLRGEPATEDVDGSFTRTAAIARLMAVRVLLAAGTTGSLSILRSKAQHPDGSMFLAGDVFIYNYEEWGLEVHVRAVEVKDDGGEALDVKVEIERSVFPSDYTPTEDDRNDPDPPSPDDFVHTRIFELPPHLARAGFPAHVGIIAQRENAGIYGYDVWMTTEANAGSRWNGEEMLLSTETSFGVRCTLNASITDVAASLAFTTGNDDFDLQLAEGFSAAVAQDNEYLVLIGDELISLGEMTDNTGASWEFNVLRGRLGTAAAGHTAGDHVWLFRRDQLSILSHEAFKDAPMSVWFKLVPKTVAEDGNATAEIPVDLSSVGQLLGLSVSSRTALAGGFQWDVTWDKTNLPPNYNPRLHFQIWSAAAGGWAAARDLGADMLDEKVVIDFSADDADQYWWIRGWAITDVNGQEIYGPVATAISDWVYPDQLAPDPPTNGVGGWWSTSNSITLEWDDSASTDVQSYGIFRYVDGLWQFVTQVPPGTGGWVIENVFQAAAARDEYFVVVAYDRASPPNKSANLQFTVNVPALATPQDFTVAPSNHRKFDATWTPIANDDGFVIIQTWPEGNTGRSIIRHFPIDTPQATIDVPWYGLTFVRAWRQHIVNGQKFESEQVLHGDGWVNVTDFPPPTAPTSLAATYYPADNYVYITWSDSADYWDKNYAIYTKIESKWELIGLVRPGEQIFVHHPIYRGPVPRTLEYRVYAIGENDLQINYDEVNASIPALEVPGGVSTSTAGVIYGFDLLWSPVSGNDYLLAQAWPTITNGINQAIIKHFNMSDGQGAFEVPWTGSTTIRLWRQHVIDGQKFESAQVSTSANVQDYQSPGNPSGLSASAEPGAIVLGWTYDGLQKHADDPITQIHVYRGKNEATPTLHSIVPGGVKTFRDELRDEQEGDTWNYRIYSATSRKVSSGYANINAQVPTWPALASPSVSGKKADVSYFGSSYPDKVYFASTHNFVDDEPIVITGYTPSGIFTMTTYYVTVFNAYWIELYNKPSNDPSRVQETFSSSSPFGAICYSRRLDHDWGNGVSKTLSRTFVSYFNGPGGQATSLELYPSQLGVEIEDWFPLDQNSIEDLTISVQNYDIFNNRRSVDLTVTVG